MRVLGATTIIAVDGNDHRLGISHSMGPDVTLNFRNCELVEEVMKLTGGRGADSAIEALGTQATLESALRVLEPGGTLSSLGVYSSDLTIPLLARPMHPHGDCRNGRSGGRLTSGSRAPPSPVSHAPQASATLAQPPAEPPRPTPSRSISAVRSKP